MQEVKPAGQCDRTATQPSPAIGLRGDEGAGAAGLSEMITFGSIRLVAVPSTGPLIRRQNGRDMGSDSVPNTIMNDTTNLFF